MSGEKNQPNDSGVMRGQHKNSFGLIISNTVKKCTGHEIHILFSLILVCFKLFFFFPVFTDLCGMHAETHVGLCVRNVQCHCPVLMRSG
jgi:hypothetical protein